ncbi:MAG: DUF3604 domain-containing protein [Nanoarchaeota archaeon]|nr:DUF3604 domain-containing protein [Nanoarchaeota archaeon]
MENQKTEEFYGRGLIESAEDIVAGSYTTVRLIYVVGAAGIATGGRIRIYTDSDTDWEFPQFDEPSAADYMTIQAPAPSQVSAMVRNVKTVLLTVNGRSLQPGDTVTLIYGDKSSGGPGTRAQTFIEKKRFFWISVDLRGDGGYVTLKNSPHIAIIGDHAARLVVTAPSYLNPGELFRLTIKAEDQWGNPARNYQDTVSIKGHGVTLPVSEITFEPAHQGVYVLEGCCCPDAGTYRIEVHDGVNDLISKSGPIICTDKPLKHRLYWGDPHGGQVEMAEKIPDFFQYARDVSAIDFTGYQRNDHALSPEAWKLQQQAEERFYQPGRFVPLPGFEWSGTTKEGGHHNVYFRRHHQPIRRSGHSELEDKSDIDTDLPHIKDVHKAYRYKDVVITPHVGGYPADLTFHEPTLEPAIEITSTHGSFEWFLEDALKRGYQVGFVGGSDGYTGRPGGEYPGHLERRYAKGGYTGLYAKALTLESLLEALKARRCYATTGERMIVNLTADDHLMGDAYFSESLPQLSGFVAGTAPIESIELYRGLEKIYDHPIALNRSPNRVRLLWNGASTKASYTGVIWEGSLSVSGARISDVECVRFDSPRSRVINKTDSSLDWYAVSCGYSSGLILTVSGDPSGEFQVVINTTLIRAPQYGAFGDMPPMKMSYGPADRVRFTFNMKELSAGSREIEIGPLNRKIRLSLAPEPGTPETAQFAHVDKSPRPGINPYWMRVKQTNMEMAWTSPVFLDYAGK